MPQNYSFVKLSRKHCKFTPDTWASRPSIASGVKNSKKGYEDEIFRQQDALYTMFFRRIQRLQIYL